MINRRVPPISLQYAHGIWIHFLDRNFLAEEDKFRLNVFLRT
jgi:hypothetical protein